MPKKINDLERTDEETPQPLGNTQTDMIASVQPLKKKRVMSEEQKARQLENLRKGRETRAANIQAKVKETAKMLHDTVVQQEVNTKPKKEDHKLKKILEAVGSIAPQDEEPEEEIVVVKKRRAPKKTIIIQEEEEEEAHQPPPPPQVVPKPKRQYNRKKAEVQAPEPEPAKVEAPAPKQSIIFY